MNSVFQLKSEPVDLNQNVQVVIEKQAKFACTECPAKFFDNLHLIAHTDSCHSVNGGPRTFNCPHCLHFSHESRLKVMQHMKKIHLPRYKFACPFCPQSFDSQLYLSIHRRQCHNSGQYLSHIS